MKYTDNLFPPFLWDYLHVFFKFFHQDSHHTLGDVNRKSNVAMELGVCFTWACIVSLYSTSLRTYILWNSKWIYGYWSSLNIDDHWKEQSLLFYQYVHDISELWVREDFWRKLRQLGSKDFDFQRHDTHYFLH